MSAMLDANTLIEKLADATCCRYATNVATGDPHFVCIDRPKVRRVGCEHEHTYDVALCDRHASTLPDVKKCPQCSHGCLHGVIA